MTVCHYGSDDGEHYGSDNDECAMMTEGCATAPVLQTGRTAFQCLQYYQQHLNTEMLSRCHCCCLCWISSESLVFSVHCCCLLDLFWSVFWPLLLSLGSFWNSVFWPLLLSLGSLLKQCFLATAAVSWISSETVFSGHCCCLSWISSESLVFSSVYLSWFLFALAWMDGMGGAGRLHLCFVLYGWLFWFLLGGLGAGGSHLCFLLHGWGGGGTFIFCSHE